MPTFTYTALDVTGREIQGTLEATDTAAAVAKIREMGVFPTSISESSENKGSDRTDTHTTRPSQLISRGNALDTRPNDDFYSAVSFFRYTFWSQLMCVASLTILLIAAVVGSLQAGGVSNGSNDFATVMATFGSCGFLFIALPVTVLSWKDMGKCTTALSHPDWSRLSSSVRKWMGLALFGWLIPFAGVFLFPISLFIWHLRLSQLCRLVGVLCNSNELQKKVKEVIRNFWILLGEAVGLVLIGCLLATQPGHPFLGILAAMLLVFLIYCLVYLLIVVRVALNVLNEAARRRTA